MADEIKAILQQQGEEVVDDMEAFESNDDDLYKDEELLHLSEVEQELRKEGLVL